MKDKITDPMKKFAGYFSFSPQYTGSMFHSMIQEMKTILSRGITISMLEI